MGRELYAKMMMKDNPVQKLHVQNLCCSGIILLSAVLKIFRQHDLLICAILFYVTYGCEIWSSRLHNHAIF